jgi:hypothetical protein
MGCRPFIGSSESVGLVGEEDVASVDVDLVKQAAFDGACGCSHGHVAIVPRSTESIIRETPQDQWGLSAYP